MDPIQLEAARDRVVRLSALAADAARRAAHPPALDESAWRGPAFLVYRSRAEELARRLRAAAAELRAAADLAREELARAL